MSLSKYVVVLKSPDIEQTFYVSEIEFNAISDIIFDERGDFNEFE